MQYPNTEPTKQIKTPPPSSGQAPTPRSRIRRFGLAMMFFAALLFSATASHLSLSRVEHQKVADVVADLNQSAGQILEEFELSLSHLGHYVGDTVQKLELEGKLAQRSRFDQGPSNLLFDTVRTQLGHMRALGALVCRRVYKDAFSFDSAIEIIEAGRGKHFDPAVVDAFKERLDTFIEISRRLADQ